MHDFLRKEDEKIGDVEFEKVLYMMKKPLVLNYLNVIYRGSWYLWVKGWKIVMGIVSTHLLTFFQRYFYLFFNITVYKIIKFITVYFIVQENRLLFRNMYM